MNIRKMSQKQFEANFKKQALAYARNMCIFCKHNENCQLPLHGHFRMEGEACSQAEHPDQEQLFALVAEHFYGPELKDEMLKRMRGGCHDFY